MRLRMKFNLILLGTFAVGLTGAAIVSDALLRQAAREEVLMQARIMMANAMAMREYTSTEIRPLLFALENQDFRPHVVPSFAAQANFRRMAGDFPDYAYKEAALNPTNPEDRATDWEADIIQAFRQDADRPELIATRETPTGRALVLARPISVDDPSCLDCHSTAEAAPPEMIEAYGTSNGFGWQLGETVGAQVVSVPMSVPLERARTHFLAMLGTLAAGFLVTALLINVLLRALVLRPVERMSSLADAVSLGNMDAPEFNHAARDEIGALSAAFNRMRRSLETALRMLGS